MRSCVFSKFDFSFSNANNKQQDHNFRKQAFNATSFSTQQRSPNTMATFPISQWMPSDPLKRIMDAVPSHDEMWMALANAGIPVSEIPKCIEKEEWIELTTFKWEEKDPEPTIWHWGTNPQDGSSVAKAREWHKTCVDDNVVFITASTEEWYKKRKTKSKKWVG